MRAEFQPNDKVVIKSLGLVTTVVSVHPVYVEFVGGARELVEIEYSLDRVSGDIPQSDLELAP